METICKVCGQPHATGACVIIDANKDIFAVPQDPNMEPLDDEDKTPVSHMKPAQQDLRGGSVVQAGERNEQQQRDLREIKGREPQHVFDDVRNNRDSEVVGFIKRGIRDVKFNNFSSFKLFVEDLFGGENDPAGEWSLEDDQPLAKMTVELRVQIGDSRPIVEVLLVNERGQGSRKGHMITRVGEVRMLPERPRGDLQAEEKRVAADSSLWKKATGWFKMVRNKE